ncbi:hypothetical protein BIWAKO_04025 [Bosea sp. BIWAKO-01]|nr:hypothetical protein BIWAKO_04025 [Bosea sp. BIWAKO-01]
MLHCPSPHRPALLISGCHQRGRAANYAPGKGHTPPRLPSPACASTLAARSPPP